MACFWFLNSVPLASGSSLATNHYFPSLIKVCIMSFFLSVSEKHKIKLRYEGKKVKKPPKQQLASVLTPRWARLHLNKAADYSNMSEACFMFPIHNFKHEFSKFFKKKKRREKILGFQEVIIPRSPNFQITTQTCLLILPCFIFKSQTYFKFIHFSRNIRHS